MGSASGSRTSVSLLCKLGDDPTDQTAWNRLVDCYGPRIHGWCRRWCAQEADAEDVTQQVLLNLVRHLRTYDRAKGRFRTWLRAVTRHALQDYLENQQLPGKGTGDSDVRQLLETVEAREDLEKRLEAEFDLELQEEAMAQVRLRVRPDNWEAFRLTALAQVPPAEAAAQLGMTIARVYVARNRVQKMLRAVIDELERPAGE